MTSGHAPWNIVVIEDHDPDVFLIREALRSHRIESSITHFKDSEEAVRRLCAANGGGLMPLPDLILLDLNMPRLTGIDVLKAIRGNSRLAHVPVAILTSSHSPADRKEAAEAGATAYIPKQPVLHDFLESVGGTVSRLLWRDPGGAVIR